MMPLGWTGAKILLRDGARGRVSDKERGTGPASDVREITYVASFPELARMTSAPPKSEGKYQLRNVRGCCAGEETRPDASPRTR